MNIYSYKRLISIRNQKSGEMKEYKLNVSRIQLRFLIALFVATANGCNDPKAGS